MLKLKYIQVVNVLREYSCTKPMELSDLFREKLPLMFTLTLSKVNEKKSNEPCTVQN